jgi:hypothetical protein
MARSWEGKSIQAQIEAAKARHGIPTIRLTPEEAEMERKRESLLLHRTRIMHDLDKCNEEKYRTILTAGLAYLESRLTALGWRGSTPAEPD